MDAWDRTVTALRLLAVDPGLGGLVLRARVGPVRDAVMQAARDLGLGQIRLHPQMTAEVLDDGIDLAATLQRGTVIEKQGLLKSKECQFTLSMAERSTQYLTNRLAAMLDSDVGNVLIALDEGATDEEVVPGALADRLAFFAALDDIPQADIKAVDRASGFLSPKDVTTDSPFAEQLVVLAVKLGIASLRAPYLALRCAKAHAALCGRRAVTADDIAVSAALVFAHRATQLPDDTPPPSEAPENDAQSDGQQQGDHVMLPDDILLAAVKAVLPAGLLDKLQNQALIKGKGAGSGQKKIGNRRGRPLPARGVRAHGDGRIDLIATLRAAIPWQTLRKRDDPTNPRAIILPADIRHKRYEDTSDRLLIFTVDASGSAAAARLGEAKGAVEILLTEAYARRDHVALISFRGDTAEVILPPTRSLVQTKRRLAALAGGGGTPLASGMAAALEMAGQATKRGLTPTIILLTDGRSNVTLDGQGDRQRAAQDVGLIARAIAVKRQDVIVIDTGKRPEQSLKFLAKTLSAPYVALPRADARSLSDAVSNSLDA